MHEKSKKFDLNLEQKTRLFNICLDSEQLEDEDDIEHKKTDLLNDLLAKPLPVVQSLFNSLPKNLDSICRDLNSLAGDPLGKLLQDQETNISILENIKNWAKQLGSSSSSQIEHDVTLVIYHAAIAVAILFHNKKITHYSSAELKCSFTSLSNKSWIPQDISLLFTQACDKFNKYV